MLELNNALELIIKTIEKASEEYGFKVEYPEGVRPPELPVTVVGSKSIVMFRSENGRIRLEHNGDKISLHCARANEADTPDDDMRRVSLSLLDLETFNEKDLKYLAEDYAESFKKNFSTKSPYSGKKAPTPVSRTQAKSGALAYDANTLGSRFTTIFPQLRDEYKKNLEAYGEFLAEDFFVNHGNAVVLETLRENDKIKMRQLFKLLNDIYEDGTNDTQSLVAVTILGSTIASDMSLLETAQEYFSDTMKEPVTEVIKYLSKSKSARMRLEHPPVYKPKKDKKKKGMLSMLGM